MRWLLSAGSRNAGRRLRVPLLSRGDLGEILLSSIVARHTWPRRTERCYRRVRAATPRGSAIVGSFGRRLLVCGAGALRREAVPRFGSFDPQVWPVEDADFDARVMRTCSADVIDDVVLDYRIGITPRWTPRTLRPGTMALATGRPTPGASLAYGMLEFYGAAFARFVVQRL